MMKLIINDLECDITGVEAIVITYVRNDLGDIATRNGDYSNNFSLPKTAKNKAIFGNINMLDSASSVSTSSLKYRIEVSGIIVSIGYAQVKSVSDTFNLFLKSNNSDFFDKIRGLKLQDLDLLAYQHIWNIANTVAANLNTDGYIYPVIDGAIGALAMDNTNRVFDVSTHVPAMFYHTLISEIATQAGFTLIGDFLNDARYKSLVVPCITALVNFDNHPLGASVESSQDNLYNVAATNVDFYKSVNFETEIFDNGGNYQQRNFSISGQPSSSNYSWLSYGGDCQVDVTLNFSANIAGAAKVRIGVYEYRSGSFGVPGQTYIYEQQEGSGVLEITGGDVINKSVTIQAFPTTLSAGDLIYVAVQVTNSVGDISDITIDSSSFAKFTPLGQKYINTRQLFDVGYNLPKLTQESLLKNLLMSFCLLMDTDADKKTIEFKKFSTIANDKANALDWSDKLDETESEEISFDIGDYAKVNQFTYTDDDTIPIASINSSFSLDNDNLDEQKVIFASPFSGCPMTKKLIDLDVPTALLFDVQVPSLELKPKILTLDVTDLTSNLTYQNDGVVTASPPAGIAINTMTDIPLCHFSYFTKDFNLDWDSLLGDYYIEIIKALSNPKKLTCKIRLKSIDIAELDMFKLVWIEKYKSHFYINKISQYDYTTNDSTEVELIKLP